MFSHPFANSPAQVPKPVLPKSMPQSTQRAGVEKKQKQTVHELPQARQPGKHARQRRDHSHSRDHVIEEKPENKNQAMPGVNATNADSLAQQLADNLQLGRSGTFELHVHQDVVASGSQPDSHQAEGGKLPIAKAKKAGANANVVHEREDTDKRIRELEKMLEMQKKENERMKAEMEKVQQEKARALEKAQQEKARALEKAQQEKARALEKAQQEAAELKKTLNLCELNMPTTCMPAMVRVRSGQE